MKGARQPWRQRPHCESPFCKCCYRRRALHDGQTLVNCLSPYSSRYRAKMSYSKYLAAP